MKSSYRVRQQEPIQRLLSKSRNADIIDRNQSFFLNEKYTMSSANGRSFLNSWFPSLPSEAWDRMLDGVDHIANGGRRPMQADIVLTGDCHCKCWHCFRSRFEDKSALETKHIKNFLHAAHSLGTTSVGFTGGEPMIREDLLSVFALIPKGIEGQLYTTGHNVTEEFVRGMESTRVSRVLVSLDHYDAGKANARRGYANAFDEAIHAVKLFSQSSIYSAVSVCITNDLLEEGELHRYFEFASQLGADEIRVLLPIPQGNLTGRNDKLLYLRAMKELRALRAQLLDQLDQPTLLLFCEYENAGCFGCGAGSNYICLNNDGSVAPCVAVPLSFGNVKETPFEVIYASMAEYFENSGRTCFGRRAGSAVLEANPEGKSLPLSEDKSREIASRHRVDGDIGDFFAPFRLPKGSRLAC